MKIHPIGNYLFVRKCINGEEEKFNGQIYHKKGNLVLCAGSGQNTNFAEIIAVGPQCKDFSVENIGQFIICPELSNGMSRITGEDFAVRETAIDVKAVFS